ncbi:MAG: arginase family protein [Alphaproteobacteria bacterium]|nr:arginase family protein [Alphaproteobacteria bacterium]
MQLWQHYFGFLTTLKAQQYYTTRSGEIKLGQIIKYNDNKINWEDFVSNSNAKYVIFGVEESIGVKANFGKSGTHTAWQSFLPNILNAPINDYLPFNDIIVLGSFNFEELEIVMKRHSNTPEEKRNMLLQGCQEINNYVVELVCNLVLLNKFPILIGGGHNLAYAMLKGVTLALIKKMEIVDSKINVLNIDAHLDLRHLEGMHSGNGFRYALEEGFLGKYYNLGAFENNISQYMLDLINNNAALNFETFENMFIRNKISPELALDKALANVSNNYYGVELDVDIIENVLSSAQTPIGISTIQALKWLYNIGKSSKSKYQVYLSLVEGAVRIDDNPFKFYDIGKLLSIFVLEFIKAKKED